MVADIQNVALALAVGLPLTMLLVLGLVMAADKTLSEKLLSALIHGVMLGVITATVTAATLFVYTGSRNAFDYGIWYGHGETALHWVLLGDGLSLALAVTAAFITAVVGWFSARYLHRDPGFQRYFLCYLAFAAGCQLLFLAGTAELLIVGWELVGISSALLISFFQERRGPVLNGVTTFTVYRVCDIGLLGAALALHHTLGSSALPVFGLGGWPAAPMIVGALIIFAALGKSAQLPFSFWLPRAMEGPTPSSAVYYGALSIHAGAYLLIRTAPFWEQNIALRIAICAVGLATAAYAAFVGRTRSDVKTLLAYASMAQVGLIFTEVGLGFYKLAIVHIVGHAMLRTLQLLRAPSALRDWQELGLAPHAYWEQRLPPNIQAWLYRQALAHARLEDIVRIVLKPVLRLANFLDASERDFIRGMQLETRRPPALVVTANNKDTAATPTLVQDSEGTAL